MHIRVCVYIYMNVCNIGIGWYVCVGHETRRGERGGDLNPVGKELTMENV